MAQTTALDQNSAVKDEKPIRHTNGGPLWLTVLVRVFRRDIVFAILPFLVSIVLLRLGELTVEEVLRMPDLVFATIVFLGLAITQGSEAFRKKMNASVPANESVQNTQVVVFVLLVVSVLVLGQFIIKNKNVRNTAEELPANGVAVSAPVAPGGGVGSQQPPAAGDSKAEAVTAPAGYTSLLFFEGALFLISIAILLGVNYRKEKRLRMQEESALSRDRDEIVESCQEAVQQALIKIDLIYKNMKALSKADRKKQDGFDPEGDSLRQEIKKLLSYTADLQATASEYMEERDFTIPSTRPLTGPQGSATEPRHRADVK